jgi:RNA polymerase sigma-70 factor (ECF subfamily)
MKTRLFNRSAEATTVSASDATDFEQVIERYSALIKAVIARTYSGGLELNADDIVQEVKIKLWKELSKQEKIVNLKAFICQIAFTTTIDEIRKIKTRRQEPLPEQEQEMDLLMSGRGKPDPPTPQVELERKEIQRLVVSAVDSLGDNRRQVVKLYLYGMNYKEIAAELGWSEGKARNLLYRGLEELSEILKSKGVSYEIGR